MTGAMTNIWPLYPIFFFFVEGDETKDWDTEALGMK